MLSLQQTVYLPTPHERIPRETTSDTRGKGDVQTEYTIMPVQEACLRTRLLATRRAPALLSRVPARSISVPSIPSKADRREMKSALQRRPGGDSKIERQDRSVALFKDVVGAGRGRPSGGSASEKIAETMFRLRSGLVGVQGAWRTLNDEILPSVGEGEDIAPALRGLLEIMMGIKRHSVPDGEEPRATELARLYVGAGRANSPTPLVRMMTVLLEHLSREGPDKNEAVVQDIVGLWTVMLWPKASDPAGIKLPSLRSSKMQKLLRGREPFAAAVRAALPPTRPSQTTGVPAVLLATYVMMETPRLRQGEGDLLTEEPSLRSSGAVAAIEPLLAFTEQLIGAVWVNPEQALRELKDSTPALHSYVGSRLDVLQPKISPKLDVDQFHRSLSRGFKARDPEQIRRTWEALSKQVETTAPRFADNPALRDRYADLLNFCVCIWCALGQEDVDVVLGFMAEHGFGYTLKTYTSMMEGWKQARRPRNIELLWDRLVADDVPLDSVIWSARISALMTCGLEKPAVRALYELGNLWDEAVKRSQEGGTKGNAVKPVIGPVNAALTGVLRSKGVKAAPAILNWAAQYNIDPDIATYNMLLRAMFREGRGTEADALLGDMKARGVAADAATFTIIVEEVLGAAAGQTEEAQLAAVRGIFSAIEGSKQKAQVATYAKMIHELLGGRDGEEGGGASSAAVREVLAHMRDSGAEPTPHIFTIVADHHLSRGEVDAVRDMISSWRLEGSDRVDGVFWEVVIKGLARAGLAAEAKAVFFGLRRETRVALGVLDQLLVGLLEEGDVEGARELVAAVRERMGVAWGVSGEGERGERYMKHHFWHVVAEYGLDVE